MEEMQKMTIEEKLDLIANTLDADHSAISTIAMLDRKFKKVLSAEQIEKLTSVQDILDRMEE
jgi:acyl carrier protein